MNISLTEKFIHVKFHYQYGRPLHFVRCAHFVFCAYSLHNSPSLFALHGQMCSYCTERRRRRRQGKNVVFKLLINNSISLHASDNNADDALVSRRHTELFTCTSSRTIRILPYSIPFYLFWSLFSTIRMWHLYVLVIILDTICGLHTHHTQTDTHTHTRHNRRTFISVMANALKSSWEALKYLEFHLLTNATDAAGVVAKSVRTPFIRSAEKVRSHSFMRNGYGKNRRSEFLSEKGKIQFKHLYLLESAKK